MKNQTTQKWYQKPVSVILFLIFFFPVGLYLMWKNELWSKTTRVVVSVFFGLLVLGSYNNNKSNSVTNYNSYNDHKTRYGNECEDMESYNQGLREGRLQRGMLTDCETYYPYEGWADNKKCYCEGFEKGRRE